MKRVIWMFSGQGSQYFQMGRELYEGSPVFRRCLERGDAVVRELIHESVVEMLYRPRKERFEPFRRVLFTHPAILLVGCALAEVLAERGLEPDLMLGHSLGELASWVAAGALPLEEALVLAVKQAELVEYCVPEGGMLAVLERADLVEREPRLLGDGCEIAGVSFGKSFILTGRTNAIQAAQATLKELGVSCLELPVAHPFHSRWTGVIRTPCLEVLGRLKPGRPRVPLLSSVRRDPMTECAPTHLWEATQGRIDFSARVQELEREGPALYVDLGPSGSLATAVKYNLEPGSRSAFASVMTPFGMESRHLDRLVETQRQFLSN